MDKKEYIVNSRTQIDRAFKAWNSAKRALTLADIAKSEGRHDDAIRHELEFYKQCSRLELSLRAIQKGIRDLEGDISDDWNDNNIDRTEE